MENDGLQERFRKVGKKHGYETVNAEFVSFKEFKVRWQRSYKWADFKVSDYMADAPPEVIEGLASTLFARICGKGDPDFSEEMCKWVTAPDFSRYKQPTYLRRSRNLSRSRQGQHRDLGECYRRLIDAGLAQDDPGLFLSWTKEPNVRKVGYCSVLMKVVAISSALDSPEVPEFVADYVMYHELCHIMIGFDPSSEKHGIEFAELESKYPRQKEAEDWLRRLCMYL
ncbi:MAG: M48 family metallopeptidase [Candidatus Methanomethylophilaceae archaeon]|jgi:hypothetical protein|nr:M48 family metallopeptidase [Candidatus Methanomethylophilaceae archaeon]NCA73567.1 M48 family peptidase [Gammaproteobacteria bacterium]MDD2935748.1 M48 family metallopeptidase [Candidatus Methanomethylophilaceae archaeon]MDD3351489.1 M48 family metallopeptidase [Candidatus Methanomethylophilaceae archaeon]MDD3986502.1 M48 family metallopeptidase [Candidatus Methanomethylophilaceae archaeon]